MLLVVIPIEQGMNCVASRSEQRFLCTASAAHFYFKSLSCTFRHRFADYPRRDKKNIIILCFGLISVRFGALRRQNAKRKEEEKT